MKRESGQEACPGYLRLGLFSLILNPQASNYPEEKKTLGLFPQPPPSASTSAHPEEKISATFTLYIHKQAPILRKKTLGLFQQPPPMNGVFLILYTSDNFSSSTYLNFAKVQSDLLKHAKVQIFSQNLDV